MTQEVSRWPHTEEVRFDPDAVIVGCVVAKVVLGQVFLRVLQFYPVIIPPTHFLYHRHFALLETVLLNKIFQLWVTASIFLPFCQ